MNNWPIQIHPHTHLSHQHPTTPHSPQAKATAPAPASAAYSTAPVHLGAAKPLLLLAEPAAVLAAAPAPFDVATIVVVAVGCPLVKG